MSRRDQQYFQRSAPRHRGHWRRRCRRCRRRAPALAARKSSYPRAAARAGPTTLRRLAGRDPDAKARRKGASACGAAGYPLACTLPRPVCNLGGTAGVEGVPGRGPWRFAQYPATAVQANPTSWPVAQVSLVERETLLSTRIRPVASLASKDRPVDSADSAGRSSAGSAIREPAAFREPAVVENEVRAEPIEEERSEGRPTRYACTLDPRKIDPDAAKVVRRLVRHGYEAYLVGGCVRDSLLGRSPKDFDV